jgi:hypothetical protein
MKSKSLVTVILLLGSGTALAEQQITTVQVRPVASYTLEISCSNPETPSADKVETLLQISDKNQTHALSNKLMAAAAEACNASIAAIVVTRSGRALSWVAGQQPESVAAN